MEIKPANTRRTDAIEKITGFVRRATQQEVRETK